jgi:hypothetical protein
MTNYPILFNQSPEQLRRIGGRGGRACGRNQRVRRATEQTAAPAVPSPAPSLEEETVAEAIAVLDQQFPWLRGAEKRRSRPCARAPGAPAITRACKGLWGHPHERHAAGQPTLADSRRLPLRSSAPFWLTERRDRPGSSLGDSQLVSSRKT